MSDRGRTGKGPVSNHARGRGVGPSRSMRGRIPAAAAALVIATVVAGVLISTSSPTQSGSSVRSSTRLGHSRRAAAQPGADRHRVGAR
jgi:hypothetical protein